MADRRTLVEHTTPMREHVEAPDAVIARGFRHTIRGVRKDLHGDWAERQIRKAYVDAHVQVHGYVCPGWNRGSHPARDLTADHPVPVARGGPAKGQPYAVLCRSCNGRKAGRLDAEQARTPEVRSRPWL